MTGKPMHLLMLEDMLHSEIRNYIVPGLSSFLVGGEDRGMIRLFKSQRETREHIVPHSHRFDFTCLVLQGWAENTIFVQHETEGDAFCVGTLCAESAGKYEFEPGNCPSYWKSYTTRFNAGMWYSMSYCEVHSIRFSDDAMVLFFEGPEVEGCTTVLEPWAYGKRIPTFKTEDWMFEHV